MQRTEKRGADAAGSRVKPTQPNPSPTPPEALLCLACDYDLTGLAREGMCPECDAPVSLTLNYEAASRRVEGAVVVALWCVIVGLAVWSAGLLLVALNSILARPSATTFGSSIPIGLLVGAVLAAIMCYFFAFFAALSGRPGAVSASRARSPREAMCLGTLIILGLTILILSTLPLLGNLIVPTSVAPLVGDFSQLAFWAAPFAVAAIYSESAKAHYFGPRIGLWRLCRSAVLCALAPFTFAAIVSVSIFVNERSFAMRPSPIPDRLPVLALVAWGCWQATASVRLARRLTARARSERSAALS